MMRSDDGFEDGGEDFATLLAEYEGAGARKKPKAALQPGDTVKGRIVSIGKEAVLVDLGMKSEGVIAVAEVQDSHGQLTVKPGDTIEARVAELDGRSGAVVLRVRAGRGGAGADEVRAAFEAKIPVEGTVSAVNKGGVEVQLMGLRAFCPISQLDLRHVADGNAFLGLKLTFLITRFEGGRGKHPNVVVSRRILLEKEAAARADEARARLSPGLTVRGRVTSLRDYGAFVDLGGIEGMLHISELGFGRVAHPRDVLAEGQEVDVQILKMERTDDPKRPDRISLSLRALQKDPWDDVREKFPIGSRVKGSVVRVETFGAFVELAPGIEGLVHISELAAGRPARHARELVKPGDPYEALVLELDPPRRRISLGAAGDAEEAGALERYKPVLEGPRDTLGDLLRQADTPEEPKKR